MMAAAMPRGFPSSQRRAASIPARMRVMPAAVIAGCGPGLFPVDYYVDLVYIVVMPEPVYLGEFEQLVLLAVLRLGADASGAAVARELEQQAGRRVSRGALYTT